MKTPRTSERSTLVKSAKTATSRALRVSTAMDLPIKIISKGVLVEQLPNGEVKEIRQIVKVKANKTGLKKGSTLCLK